MTTSRGMHATSRATDDRRAAHQRDVRGRLLAARTGTALVVGLILAGCGGGSDTPKVDAAVGVPSSSVPSSRANVPVTTAAATAKVTTTTVASNAMATVTAPTPPAQQVVATRVRAFFAARDAANAAPVANPDAPQLADAASGTALQDLRDETTRRRDAGQAIRNGQQNLAAIRVGFVTVNGATATAAACSIDDGVIFEVTTGQVVNDAVMTHNYRIDLELTGDVWRVSQIVRIQQWNGRAGCANSPGDFPY